MSKNSGGPCIQLLLRQGVTKVGAEPTPLTSNEVDELRLSGRGQKDEAP